MKIKNLTTLLVILLTAQVSLAQKVKIKKNIVTINKEAICMVEKDVVNSASFYINDMNNEQLLYLKWVNWGPDSYYEVYRADDIDNLLFDTDDGVGFRKWIIKKLYNTKVINSDGLDEEKLNQFSKKVGKEFNRSRNRY